MLAAGAAASQGNIPAQWITAQVTTLNKAYSFASVTFVLASVDRTVNPAWYNMQQGSSDEVHMQSANSPFPHARHVSPRTSRCPFTIKDSSAALATETDVNVCIPSASSELGGRHAAPTLIVQ